MNMKNITLVFSDKHPHSYNLISGESKPDSATVVYVTTVTSMNDYTPELNDRHYTSLTSMDEAILKAENAINSHPDNQNPYNVIS